MSHCSSRLCGSAKEGAAPDSLSLLRLGSTWLLLRPGLRRCRDSCDAHDLMSSAQKRAADRCQHQGHGLSPRGRCHKVQQSSQLPLLPQFCQATCNALVFRAAATITRVCGTCNLQHSGL